MKFIICSFIVAGCSLLTSVPALAAPEVSCECPKLACDPCSYQQSIKFFTEKCGPSDSKLKSCARPNCLPIDEATKECPNPPKADSGPRAPVVVGSVPTVNEADIKPTAPVAGKVKVIQGSVNIVHTDGKKSVITQDTEIREGETIESGKDSAAVVNFEGGNKLHIHPDTAVEVKEYKDPKVDESRKALLNLIKGKVRSQVEQKYNGKTSTYRIVTRGAVAGVRGTDFVMEQFDDTKLETKVETLQGKVILASLDEKETRELLRGDGARFTVDLPDASFKDKDISAFIRKGTMSPVYKIPADQLKELEKSSSVYTLARAKKTPVRKDQAICKEPKGLFNQCVWKCVTPVADSGGGPAKCQECTRQRCNGNGQWAEETKIPPKSSAVICPSSGHIVKDCDY